MAANFKTILAAVAGVAVAMAGACGSPLAPKVAAVIDRTKSARSDYAVFNWARIYTVGRPASEQWAAEFNAGRLHRVETPQERVIADCEAMTGSYLQLANAKITRGPQIAAEACGIDTNYKVDASVFIGRQASPFGPVDVIRLIGSGFARTYAVSDQGVIIRSTFQYQTHGLPYALQTLSTSLSLGPQDPDMFSEASLGRSFVPDAMKSGPTGQRWAKDLVEGP